MNEWKKYLVIFLIGTAGMLGGHVMWTMYQDHILLQNVVSAIQAANARNSQTQAPKP